MKLVSLSLLASVALAAPAFGAIDITNLSPSNIFTGGGVPQWDSGLIDLTSYNLSIGPDNGPVTLLLELTGPVKTGTGAFADYGAGIVIDPVVQPGDEIFGFSYQLMSGGHPVGNPFGFDLNNPFNFPVDNVSTGLGGGPEATSFDAVQVTLYNNSLDESVLDTEVFIGVNPSVPDHGASLALLTLGLAALVGWRSSTRALARR